MLSRATVKIIPSKGGIVILKAFLIPYIMLKRRKSMAKTHGRIVKHSSLSLLRILEISSAILKLPLTGSFTIINELFLSSSNSDTRGKFSGL